MQNQPTEYVDQAASHLLRPRGQLGWGGVGLALAILAGLAKNSDIGRVGKKMVLRRIPLYFLSTIFHDLKPKLASAPNTRLTDGYGSTTPPPLSAKVCGKALTIKSSKRNSR